MIRINLAVERERPRVKRPVAVPGGVILLFILISIVAGAGALGVHLFFFINPSIAKLEREKTELEGKRTELAKYEKEIKDLEARRLLLDSRRSIIDTLVKNKTGPVKMLEAVRSTVSQTETLWLISMNEKSANEVEFKGLAGSVDAVANFITNLNRSGYFSNVEIKETVQKAQTRGETGPTNFEFTLSAKFSLPATPEAAPATGGKT